MIGTYYQEGRAPEKISNMRVTISMVKEENTG
jgi:hypothetical protein